MSRENLPGPDDYKDLLLRSAEVFDRPPASARRRVMKALGFGLPLTFASLSSAIAKAAAIWTKPLIGGIMLGTVVVSSVEVAEHVTQLPSVELPSVLPSNGPEPGPMKGLIPKDASSAIPARSATSAPASATSSPGTSPETSDERSVPAPVKPAPSSARTKPPRPSVTPAPIAPTASASTERSSEVPSTEAERPVAAGVATEPMVMEELSAIDAARERLARGDPTGTLQLLDRYQQNNPDGLLREEALVVRIEALARQGRQRDARALAEGFLRDHPASPYADRVRSAAK